MRTNVQPGCCGAHDHAATTPTGVLRHEHEVILRALAVLEALGKKLATREPVDPQALAWAVDFFGTFADRCHHGKEEQHLFPALARRGVPVEGGPIGTMLAEHEEGRGLLRAMAEGGAPQVAEAIARYAALLRAHIDKENEVLFPLADQVLQAGEETGLLEGFEAIERDLIGPGAHERLLAELLRREAGVLDTAVLDVRNMPPRERHPRIFATFDGLRPGETFTLVNDHDPKPLFYQFQAERTGQFEWQYAEQGPEVWRVKITRRA